MFPRMRQALLARADLLVEFATLGEYGLDEHGALLALDAVEPRDGELPGPLEAAAPALAPTVAARPRRDAAADCRRRACRPLGRRRDRCGAAAEPCALTPGDGAPARP